MRFIALSLLWMSRRFPRLRRWIRWDSLVRRWPELRRQVRLHDRSAKHMEAKQPRWSGLLAMDRRLWEARHERAGEHILIATSVGAHVGANRLESLIGSALELRGARVSVLLCDGVLPACTPCSANLYPDAKRFIAGGPKELCAGCHGPAARMYESLGFRVHRYSELVTAADRAAVRARVNETPAASLATTTFTGAAVGEHALAGALRFFGRASLDGYPLAEAVLRQYLEAAMLTALAVSRLLTQHTFRCVVADHGIYVPQGVVGEVCRHLGVRVVHWQPAYRQNRFVFSHHDTYHRTMMTEPCEAWEDMPWTHEIDDELTGYLNSRWFGTNDWIKFVDQPNTDLTDMQRTIGVDFSRPCIGLLTNVIWDAQVSYPANAFPHMMAWLTQTIEFFRRRPELQLLIRVHPAERYAVMPSSQRVVDEIAAAFPTLPRNVFVIGPENRASTYAAMGACDTVLIYATKTGVELTSVGVPVVVAGEAWIRGKGVATEVHSPTEYERVLESLPLAKRLDPATVRRARKYAYHFFFRRMIPLTMVKPVDDQSRYELDVHTLADLLPGKDAGLDIICDGVLHGTPFIYPAEARSDAAVAAAAS
jgi:hypothetical protein